MENQGIDYFLMFVFTGLGFGAFWLSETTRTNMTKRKVARSHAPTPLYGVALEAGMLWRFG
jgi:hypothetical protein